jgi:hypothetical protein
MAYKRAVPIHAKGAEANLPLRTLREVQVHAKARRTFTQRAQRLLSFLCELCVSGFAPLCEIQVHTKARSTFTQRAQSKAFSFAASVCRLCALCVKSKCTQRRGEHSREGRRGYFPFFASSACRLCASA